MNKRTVGLWLTAFVLAIVYIAVMFSTVYAQQIQKVHRVAVLRPVASPDSLTEAFRGGLRQLGYIEGRNINIDYCFAGGREDRLPELTAELVRQNVDVIVVSSTPVTRAVRDATSTVPIVFVAVSDPVVSGLVSSLARPGGNVTGLTTEPTPELTGKRLEILREVVPQVSRIAALHNPANPASAIVSRETHEAAQKLGVKVQFLDARNLTEIESAFDAVHKTRANAVAVLLDPVFIITRYRKL